MEENNPTKTEEVLYATIEHTNPIDSNEEIPATPNTCDYAVINYHSVQETTVSEQEYEEVAPRRQIVEEDQVNHLPPDTQLEIIGSANAVQ